MPKVSVIIPVYNTERYLIRCVDSVINQTLCDLEIIILNDGTPDKSEDLILQYCEKDQRIKYYKHQNIGLGPTRNRGISLSTGDYLCFIDSDDFIENDMIECLYKTAIDDDADIVCCETLVYNEKTEKENIRKHIIKEKVKLNDINREFFFEKYYFGRVFSHNAWDKLYRASLIKDNNIQFGDNKRIFAEDNYFQLQVLTKAKVISFFDKPLYHYVIRGNSIMNTYKKNLTNRNLNMIDDLHCLYRTSGIEDTVYTKILALLFFDSINSDAINIVDNKKGYTELYKSVVLLTKANFFKEYKQYVLKSNALALEPNTGRRCFIYIVTWLLRLRLLRTVTGILYLRCKCLR